MVCIYCGGKTQVVNSRGAAKKPSVWRRRQCLQCQAIVTTREQIDLSEALRVRNHSDRLEPFQRDKLFMSVYNSLSHRKTALEDATQLTDTIIEQLLRVQANGVLTIVDLTSETLPVIKRFDKAAAVYYQAHYCV
jgi:transcriptional repressor NrdR